MGILSTAKKSLVNWLAGSRLMDKGLIRLHKLITAKEFFFSIIYNQKVQEVSFSDLRWSP